MMISKIMKVDNQLHDIIGDLVSSEVSDQVEQMLWTKVWIQIWNPTIDQLNAISSDIRIQVNEK